jgi:hypothetical protein
MLGIVYVMRLQISTYLIKRGTCIKIIWWIVAGNTSRFKPLRPWPLQRDGNMHGCIRLFQIAARSGQTQQLENV